MRDLWELPGLLGPDSTRYMYTQEHLLLAHPPAQSRNN